MTTKLRLQTICGMLSAYNCYTGGISVKEIAKQAGKSQTTVRSWIKTVNFHINFSRNIRRQIVKDE